MATTYQYKELPFDMKKPLIDILNDQGRDGWRFHSMAQKLSGGTDFKTGQPKVELMIILERQQTSILKPS
jgi:hypothetical protein